MRRWPRFSSHLGGALGCVKARQSTAAVRRAAALTRPRLHCPQVGLDAAGKTTILYKLKLGEIVTTIPTIGAPQGLCCRPPQTQTARAVSHPASPTVLAGCYAAQRVALAARALQGSPVH